MARALSWLAVILFAVTSVQLPAADETALEISDVRVGRTPGRTRVVFDLTRLPEYTLSIDGLPERVAITLGQTVPELALSPALLLGTPITRVRETPGEGGDLLVEFEPSAHIGMFEFSRLRRELSLLLGCDVDLATPDALHKSMKKDILREAICAA